MARPSISLPRKSLHWKSLHWKSLPRHSWRAAAVSVISLAVVCAVGLASAYAQVRRDDTVRYGTVIGTFGALRSSLPGVEQKYGLKYDLRDFRDSTSAMLALDQGELDMANITAQHLVRAISEGLDIAWVAGWGGGYNVLVAGKKFDTPTPDDAALAAAIVERRRQGRPVTIGVPTGSMQHAKLLLYLRSLGVNADRDVEVVNIPFPNHPRALEAGEVDMVMTICLFGAIAIDKGDARLVRHLFSEQQGKQEIGFAVNGRRMRDRPEFVQRIVSSLVDAMDAFTGNTELRIALERKYSRLPDTVIDMQERQFLKYSYRTSIADLKSMARDLRDLGWVKEDYADRVEKYVDFAFLAKATGLSPAQLSSW
jgi:NitT/TauT family transport system substrate-binding protein